MALAQDACVFCRGTGQLYQDILRHPFTCDHCSGTGDQRGMELLRAYQLGIEMMRGAIQSGTFEVPGVGLDDLRAAVGQSIRELQIDYLKSRLAI